MRSIELFQYKLFSKLFLRKKIAKQCLKEKVCCVSIWIKRESQRGGRRGGLKHLRRMQAAVEVDGAKLLNAAAEVDGATSLNAAAAMAVSPTHVVTSFNPARMRVSTGSQARERVDAKMKSQAREK